jgi:hypothetical protein
MGEKGMHIGFWWKSQRGRGLYEDLDIGGMIILKCKEDRVDVNWSHLPQDKEQS